MLQETHEPTNVSQSTELCFWFRDVFMKMCFIRVPKDPAIFDQGMAIDFLRQQHCSKTINLLYIKQTPRTSGEGRPPPIVFCHASNVEEKAISNCWLRHTIFVYAQRQNFAVANGARVYKLFSKVKKTNTNNSKTKCDLHFAIFSAKSDFWKISVLVSKLCCLRLFSSCFWHFSTSVMMSCHANTKCKLKGPKKTDSSVWKFETPWKSGRSKKTEQVEEL